MTDQKKIAELEQKLTQLDKEYGDLGAYKEYGQVIKEVLGLFKDLDHYAKNELSKMDTSISTLKKSYDSLKSEQGKHNNDLKKKLSDLKSNYDKRINSLEDNLKKNNEVRKRRIKELDDLKDGLLQIQLRDSSTIGIASGDYSSYVPKYPFNNIDVRIFDGKNEFYMTTHNAKHPKREGCFYPSMCRRKLNGGNYTISATVNNETVSRKITIDGDRTLILKFKEIPR